MTRIVPKDLPTAIAEAFGLAPISARRYGGGHINDTYLIEGTALRDARGPAGGEPSGTGVVGGPAGGGRSGSGVGRGEASAAEQSGSLRALGAKRSVRHEGPAPYILQRINDSVFSAPIELMANVARVTRHVRARLEAEGIQDVDRRVLTLVQTPEGADFHVDPYGQVWRVFEFIGGATSHEVITSPVQAYKAAQAFGHFQRLLADFEGPRLHETIPRFHDTVKRYADFAAVVQADPGGRVAEVREEVDWLLGQSELAGSMLRLAAEGVLPERITHNDTKLSNVLLDDVTGEAMCVVDLDTVMPGLSLYDFADLCRSGATTIPEDARDASDLDVDVPMFHALAEGYLAGAGSSLLPAERELLVLAGEVMTLEQAYRFLGDHLAGDTYYQTSRPGQNLDRARTQIALVKALQRHESSLNTYVASLS